MQQWLHSGGRCNSILHMSAKHRDNGHLVRSDLLVHQYELHLVNLVLFYIGCDLEYSYKAKRSVVIRSDDKLLSAAGSDVSERRQSHCTSDSGFKQLLYMQRRLHIECCLESVLHVPIEHGDRWDLVRNCGQLQTYVSMGHIQIILRAPI